MLRFCLTSVPKSFNSAAVMLCGSEPISNYHQILQKINSTNTWWLFNVQINNSQIKLLLLKLNKDFWQISKIHYMSVKLQTHDTLRLHGCCLNKFCIVGHCLSYLYVFTRLKYDWRSVDVVIAIQMRFKCYLNSCFLMAISILHCVSKKFPPFNSL